MVNRHVHIEMKEPVGEITFNDPAAPDQPVTLWPDDKITVTYADGKAVVIEFLSERIAIAKGIKPPEVKLSNG